MSAELKQNSSLSAEQRARLKALMRGASGGAKQQVIPPREDSAAPAPLSPAQRRLWILSSLDPANTAYNLASLFRLTGKLDEDALQAAVSAMEQRHEMLRTVFSENEEGEPRQQILPRAGKVLYTRDLRASLEEDSMSREERIRQVVLEEANVAFDLRNGPLWRISLIRVADDNALLLINVHHIAFDGWSLGVFVREFFGYYGEAKRKGGPRVTPLPVQYADYSIWNNRRIEAGLGAEQKRFWCDYLEGIPALLDLPRDRARPEQSSGAGSIRQLIMSYEKFQRLCELGRQEGATPFNVFMSLFTLLLYRYTGQTDIVLGSPVSGREVEESQALIGVLANTLPIRTQLQADSTFREVLRQARASALDAFAHADLSFDAIVEAVRPERVAGANPVF
ncbi:MAG TPA: condensation domain-containing protein, partial [Gammaproteobacteria bacterium]